MQKYEDLMRFMVAWQNIRRWRGRPRPKREDVLMHTFKECMNAIYALSLEKNNGQPVNELKVLTAKLFHDIGEGLLGCDIPFDIKNDSRLGGIFEEIENDERRSFLNQFPREAKNFLKSSLKLLTDKRSIEGKLCDAIEYYGYITFALAEINTEGKGDENKRDFNEVFTAHRDNLFKYEREFEFVRILKKTTEARIIKWLPEFSLRDILDIWTDRHLGRAWPDLETDENLLERTMKTAFLAAFLIPQELASGKKMNGYKILATSIVHKLDKVTFPVLSPRLRKNKKLRKYERAIRQIQKDHMLRQIENYPPETKGAITQAYLMERDRDSVEGRFFDAIKNLSYVLFAYHEYIMGKKEFYQVLDNCDSDLTTYSREFKSIKETYLPIKEDLGSSHKK